MEKYLVTIEFRYSDAPRSRDYYGEKSKRITIGIYDDFEEACIHGNNLIEKLEDKYPRHTFPDGTQASSRRFSKNGGCFGGKNTLITDMAYLKCPFSFYAKIITLKYDSVDDVLEEIAEARIRSIKYNHENNLD